MYPIEVGIYQHRQGARIEVEGTQDLAKHRQWAHRGVRAVEQGTLAHKLRQEARIEAERTRDLANHRQGALVVVGTQVHKHLQGARIEAECVWGLANHRQGALVVVGTQAYKHLQGVRIEAERTWGLANHRQGALVAAVEGTQVRANHGGVRVVAAGVWRHTSPHGIHTAVGLHECRMAHNAHCQLHQDVYNHRCHGPIDVPRCQAGEALLCQRALQLQVHVLQVPPTGMLTFLHMTV